MYMSGQCECLFVLGGICFIVYGDVHVWRCIEMWMGKMYLLIALYMGG